MDKKKRYKNNALHKKLDKYTKLYKSKCWVLELKVTEWDFRKWRTLPVMFCFVKCVAFALSTKGKKLYDFQAGRIGRIKYNVPPICVIPWVTIYLGLNHKDIFHIELLKDYFEWPSHSKVGGGRDSFFSCMQLFYQCVPLAEHNWKAPFKSVVVI